MLGALRVASADQLTAYPAVSIADGRSTTTITGVIHDSAGHLVPDGTRVVFVTTLGSFRESIATTTNGTVRAILVSGSTAGIAKITATPLAGNAGPTTLDFELVGDRSLLSSAREYIELVAPGQMSYTVDTHLIGASAVRKGTDSPQLVALRYRDTTIEASDLQLNIPLYEVRARKATLHVGKFSQYFDELYLKLNLRTGYGTTTFDARRPQFIASQGRWIGFATENNDGSLDFSVPPIVKRYGLVQIRGPRITPSKTTAPAAYFEFEELFGSPSRISAKKAVIFPGRQIQFQKADIYVAENRVMRLPLFQVNLRQTNSPVITEDLVSVSDNQLLVNYPYFLTLKPGQSSLLRFRTGDLYGRNQITSSTASLDYELNWNRGDDLDGSFAYRGIGQKDWRLELQQFMRVGSRTTASAQLSLPTTATIYGSGNISHQFNGFQSNLSGSTSQTTRGIRSSTTDLFFTTETDPRRISKTPFQLSYGFTANESSVSYGQNGTQGTNNLTGSHQKSAGLTTRLISSPIKLDSKTNLTTSWTASKLAGQNVEPGVTLFGNVSLSRQISRDFSALLSYDFTHDNFNDKYVGQHRITLSPNYFSGRFGARIFASKSLDVDRSNVFGDFEYRLTNFWKLSSAYTFDRYLSTTTLDYNVGLRYRVGWREVGLVWSKRTQRLGLQLLGATVN